MKWNTGANSKGQDIAQQYVVTSVLLSNTYYKHILNVIIDVANSSINDLSLTVLRCILGIRYKTCFA